MTTEQELLDKYKDEIFTVNVTHIHRRRVVTDSDVDKNQNRYAGSGFPLTINRSVNSMSIEISKRYRPETVTTLYQYKVPSTDINLGRNYLVKIPYFLECGIETKYFMKLVLSALSSEFQKILSTEDYSKMSLESLLHFEVFDSHDNLVFAPLDLLHPISFNYESGQYKFMNPRRANTPYIFEDNYGKFVILKANTDYSSIDKFLLTTLNIYTIRLIGVNNDYDQSTLMPIYAGLPDEKQYMVEQFISCDWDSRLLVFSHINSDK